MDRSVSLPLKEVGIVFPQGEIRNMLEDKKEQEVEAKMGLVALADPVYWPRGCSPKAKVRNEIEANERTV